MKKIFTLLFQILFFVALHAQSPQGINYQGVAYDNTGQPVANQLVGIRFKILAGSATGPVLYEERQRPSTDNTGLFAVVIGNGTVLSGSFSNINWGNGSKWLKTEMDITGGNNYIAMGCSQFWSVPYAFFADNASNSLFADSAHFAKNAGHANYSENAVHAAFADVANFANNSGYADTAGYALNIGYYSGSFTIPDGFKNVTTVVIDTSVNYTVPSGKNLYIPSSEIAVSIDSNKLHGHIRGMGANARTFIGASENSIVWIWRYPIAAFLVDKKVEWKTINVIAAPYTVPPGKQFVIVNTSASSYGISAISSGIDVYSSMPSQTCNITLNSTPCVITSNMVLAPGDTISSTGCGAGTGSVHYTINGYLMNR